MAHDHPNQDPEVRNVEEPGDTNSADIVGRTGEQMPEPSHDGIDERDRSNPADEAREDDAEAEVLPG